MSKPWNKKRRGAERHKGPCFRADDGCSRRGGQKFTCRVCLALAEQGKPVEVVSVQYCDGHGAEAETFIKRHVLSAHKGVAFLTALKMGYED